MHVIDVKAFTPETGWHKSRGYGKYFKHIHNKTKNIVGTDIYDLVDPMTHSLEWWVYRSVASQFEKSQIWIKNKNE